MSWAGLNRKVSGVFQSGSDTSCCSIIRGLVKVVQIGYALGAYPMMKQSSQEVHYMSILLKLHIPPMHRDARISAYVEPVIAMARIPKENCRNGSAERAA